MCSNAATNRRIKSSPKVSPTHVRHASTLLSPSPAWHTGGCLPGYWLHRLRPSRRDAVHLEQLACPVRATRTHRRRHYAAGPHDDNRVEQNRLGKLVRSHLGAAGDCAIATIEDGRSSQMYWSSISGRTARRSRTGAIRSSRGWDDGIVTYVHVIRRSWLPVVRVVHEGDVGRAGYRRFRDSVRTTTILPGHGETSMGGDRVRPMSGQPANGRPTRILAGPFRRRGFRRPQRTRRGLLCPFCLREAGNQPDAAYSPCGPCRSCCARRGYDRDFSRLARGDPNPDRCGDAEGLLRRSGRVIPIPISLVGARSAASPSGWRGR